MYTTVETLKGTFLFRDSSLMELQKIAEICKKRRVSEGEILVEKGQVPTKLYIVVFGSVVMIIEKNDGTEEPLTIIGNEQVLSFEAFYDEGKKSIFTARAMENCDLLEIDFVDLHRLFTSNPLLADKSNQSFQKFAINLMKILVDRLSENKMAKFL